MFALLGSLTVLTLAHMFKKARFGTALATAFGVNLAHNGFQVTLPLLAQSLLAAFTIAFLLSFIQVTWKTFRSKSEKTA